MFDVTEIKTAVGEIQEVLFKEEETGQRDVRGRKAAFAKLSELWNSEECITYREAFGKLSSMAVTAREIKDGISQAYAQFLQHGNYLDYAYKANTVYIPNISFHVMGLYTATEIMKANREIINNAFRSTPQKART
ncbi:MAG TPA: hypothetical protein VL945_00855 [Candidatus Saccharimonadales bacterium]|nr:hypothetical protein [Candidatus Saccharimonadales bacterium]